MTGSEMISLTPPYLEIQVLLLVIFWGPEPWHTYNEHSGYSFYFLSR